MKKLLIALTTALSLIAAGSFAAETSAPQVAAPKAETKAPAKSPKIHKGHLKHKATSSPAQKAQTGKPPHHHKKHHHKKHHHHKAAK
ncbi:hypothetical protein QU481_12600 [Crenobacter sp. SG2303]|uniref:Acid-shock protein n=1 Tax=Crenobacter oryzisoli TaxID=3056844 RepID=A0ABT7XPW4_9NEIS|nr:hypothetical protein [Crenobacter sp. SG2303]MDN0075728.1 hypothetical protein [Crenobacter sp. SG2303]